MKRLALVTALALGLLAAPATATPILNLNAHHSPTNAVPGGTPDFSKVETLAEGSASTDERQRVTIGATTGQYRLGFGEDETTDLPHDASPAETKAALVALPSIGASDVSVKELGSTSGAINSEVTFTGALAKTNVPQLELLDGTVPLGLGTELWFDVENVGDAATAGPLTLTVTLPTGLRRSLVRSKAGPDAFDPADWSCPGSPGEAVIVCTTEDEIPRYRASNDLAITVDVDPKLPAGIDRIVKVELSGGGVPPPPDAFERVHIDTGPAGFGIIPETFLPDFLEADGLTVERRAGSHPERLVVPFDFTTINEPQSNNVFHKNQDENIRDLVVDLPPGFIGNPTAVGECPAAALAAGICPASSQVGVSYVKIDGFIGTVGADHSFDSLHRPVYNMSHPRGSVSDLAFLIFGNPVHIKVSLDPANRYAIRSEVRDINETLPAFLQRLSVWGTPADASHDSLRCGGDNVIGKNVVIFTEEDCPAGIEPRPFLSVPAQCEDDNVFRLHHYDSWQDSGDYGPELTRTLPGLFKECDRPRFEPKVEIEPTGTQANTPTGLDVHIQVAQNENPDALATPPVKRIEVTLPEGMSFSPAFADGLESCTLAQMKLGTNEEVACPDASRIGEVSLSSPLLPEAAEGSMYLAAQGDNPFGSTFAMLLVLKDTEERGVIVKVPGRIDVDEQSGQIVTVFEDTPQFPFDDLTLKFRSGPRAPLVSPPACGAHEIGVKVSSYAQPDVELDRSNTYEIDEGPNGTPCPPDAANRPFAPSFNAGTLNPVAGAFSTFLFRLARGDHEQELAGVKTVLPPGLVAKIAGVSSCPEASIASISEALGTGVSERDNPACPASSEIGSISAGLGAGPGPNYFPGKVYLAGPYKGAPLSLVIVAPGIAGPFDLGSTVVRAALHIDPETAQVKAISDPFPTILHGVILRVRDVRLRMDRNETTINPTNCEPMSVDGEISGTGGAIFGASSPFQAVECASLRFQPRLFLRLFGGTKRGAHPKFRAVAKFPRGTANTARASVALPRSEFLDQGHIRTVCTRVQFAANACPQGSIYGTVKAKSPLLDEVVSGPIYLRSSNNPLPDIVAAFRGGRVDFNLVGRIDSVRGGIRNTFDLVPDVPVDWAIFTFQGGKKGLLVNSRDICKGKTPRATAKFNGQNGARKTIRPALKAKCKNKRKGKRSKRAHRRHLRR